MTSTANYKALISELKGTATELNNAEVILQIIFSHFDFWIVSTGDFTTVSITVWTASIQFLYTESEEYNYLVENGYDTEHSVTPMAKGILFSWLFSVSAPLVKMKEKFPPCISVKKKGNKRITHCKSWNKSWTFPSKSDIGPNIIFLLQGTSGQHKCCCVCQEEEEEEYYIKVYAHPSLVIGV